MKPFKIRKNSRPEAKLSEQVETMLKMRDWFVFRTHGNRNQKGFPDLFAAHHAHGYRWIELKMPGKYRFTDSQCYHFPRLLDNGTNIWLMNHPDIVPLMQPPNISNLIRDAASHRTIKQPKPKEPRRGPEARLQESIIARLELEGWHCMETHGNIYQQGLPDVYATHRKFGPRWIEVKCPKGWKFTPAQRQTFPAMYGAGVNIWIMMHTDTTILNERANLMGYM